MAGPSTSMAPNAPTLSWENTNIIAGPSMSMTPNVSVLSWEERFLADVNQHKQKDRKPIPNTKKNV